MNRRVISKNLQKKLHREWEGWSHGEGLSLHPGMVAEKLKGYLGRQSPPLRSMRYQPHARILKPEHQGREEEPA